MYLLSVLFILLSVELTNRNAVGDSGVGSEARAPVPAYYNLRDRGALPALPTEIDGIGGITNSEGYSYVDDVPAVPLHQRLSTSSGGGHGGHKSTSSSAHREHSQHNRTRRTQRRVTQNEKRYHSGQSAVLP